MYDPIYRDDVPEDEPSQFVTKDSGKMAEYASGMRRDTTEGKPQFRLMWPKDVPYEDQLLYRVAMLYMRGAEKYGDRNWEKSCTPEDLAHHEDALERHFHKFTNGVEDGEDHAAAIVWNVNAVLLTRRNIRLLAELDEQGRANAERIAAEIEQDRKTFHLYTDEPGTPPVAEVQEVDFRKPAPQTFNQVKVWVPGGGSVEINGELRTNPGDQGTVMVFPFYPPADVMVGQVHSREATDKMLGRETAEHSQELDATYKLPPLQQEMANSASRSLPCIACGKPRCMVGQGRCTECELKSQSPPMPTEQQKRDECAQFVRDLQQESCPLNHDPMSFAKGEYSGPPENFNCGCSGSSQPEEKPRPVHHVPLDMDGRMPCCGQTVFERRDDLLTTNPELVTCSVTAGPMPWD